MSTLTEYILKNTYTKVTAYRRLGLLREYIEEVEYKNDAEDSKLDVRSHFLNYENKNDLEAIEEWLGVFADDYGSFYQKLDEASSDLESVPTATIYTPVLFTEEIIADICQHLRKKINQDVFLENRVDDTAVGGCGLVWKNEYYDFSLNYYLKEKPNIVTNFFNQYDRES